MTSQETNSALQRAIAKWMRHARAKSFDGINLAPCDCPLCAIFFANGCKGCPIARATGKTNCRGTPYIDASRARTWGNIVDFRFHSRREVVFLREVARTEAQSCPTV